MNCNIHKMEWEYGEQYGNAYHPSSIDDFRDKIIDLHLYGLEQEYPFLVVIYFVREDLHVALSVGHLYSYLEFMFDVDRSTGIGKGPYYLSNKQHTNDAVGVYYMGSYTEIEADKMLPFKQVFEAVCTFSQEYTFSSGIRFDDDQVNSKFVRFKSI